MKERMNAPMHVVSIVLKQIRESEKKLKTKMAFKKNGVNNR